MPKPRILAGLAALTLLPIIVGATFIIANQDALEDDTEDAAAYARYMAATEASAPLMRHHKSTHGSFENPAGTPTKSIYRPPANDYYSRRRTVHVWSNWSVWSTCSRSCGSGITSRHRTCRKEYARISPGSGIRSAYNGHSCIGEPSEYSVCNPQSCSTTAQRSPEDFMLYQCSLYNNRTIRGHQVASWVPYQSGSNQCELSCRAAGPPPTLVYSFGKVLDGTRCTTDSMQPLKDFCINGRCLAVGCDGRVGSTFKRDMCYVCGGNNSTCQRVAAVAFSNADRSVLRAPNPQRITETYGYSPVVRIPKGSTHVLLSDNSTNYIALMEEGRGDRYFLNGNWIIDWPGRYGSPSGETFHYERTKDSETVRARGPLLDDLLVMALVKDRDSGIYYEYWTPKLQTAVARPVDGYRLSDGQRSIVSARMTTTVRPLSTGAPATVRRVTSARPMTTAAPKTTTGLPIVRFQQYDNATEFNLGDWDEYEPQPTAASLIRAPPRVTYRSIFAPFFKETTTESPSPTPTTTTTTTSKSAAKKLNGPKKASGPDKVKQVRQHLGVVHKKITKTNPITRSGGGVGKNGKSPCSVDGSCWKTVNGKKHFCLSEFVLRCRVLNYENINSETRYEVEVIQSYKNMIPILSREFIWAEAVPDCPCPMPYLRTGTDYIIMGKTDRGYRRNEVRLVLNADSYVRVYNQANADRVLRIRRDEAKYCQKFKTQFNLTS